MRRRRDVRDHEAGIALIMAILALMLLTVIGLTLAMTTSTEVQIAANYRWGQQALYNAEAGVEGGKRILQTLNWAALLPPARLGWNPTGTPTTMTGTGRDYEMGSCDKRGNGMGYGVVLVDGGGTALENVGSFPTLGAESSIIGSMTLWIRRPIVAAAGGLYQDLSSSDDVLILTVEGLSGSRDPARRIMEVTLQRALGDPPCEMRNAQSAGGPEGNNFFGSCGRLADDAMAGITGVTGAGTKLP
jgi:type IV pilus assembly PilX-like protein